MTSLYITCTKTFNVESGQKKVIIRRFFIPVYGLFDFELKGHNMIHGVGTVPTNRSYTDYNIGVGLYDPVLVGTVSLQSWTSSQVKCSILNRIGSLARR